MKIFWAMIALLLAALAVVWFVRSPERSARNTPVPVDPAVVAIPEAAIPRPAAEASPDDLTGDVYTKISDSAFADYSPATPTASAPTPSPAPEASKPVEPVVPSVTPAPLTPAPSSSTVPPNPDSPNPAPPTPDSLSPPDDPSDTTDPILQAIQEQMTGESPRPITLAPVAPLPHTIAAPSSSSAPRPASSASTPHSVVKQDDGTTLVDNRFIMKGSGTKADPYRITWEQLVSADEVYQPRLGRKVLPERVKMLDGKWVRMSGYIAFPIMATSNDEMLLMLNQWDGCCIGVPPTPFDAVEVKLNAAAKGETRLRATGTVQGILRVDPYLVKDWLVSLYLMDNADLVESGGMQPADSPVHGK